MNNINQTLEKIFQSIDSKLGYKSSLLLVNQVQQTLEAYNVNTQTNALIKKLVPNKFSKLSVPLEYKNSDEEGLAVKCYRTGQIYSTESMHEVVKPLLSKTTADLIQTAISVKYGIVIPVRYNKEIIAILTAGTNKPITKKDKKILIEFADIAGMAIGNSRSLSEVTIEIQKLSTENSKRENQINHFLKHHSVVKHDINNQLTVLMFSLSALFYGKNEISSDDLKEYEETTREALIKLKDITKKIKED